MRLNNDEADVESSSVLDEGVLTDGLVEHSRELVCDHLPVIEGEAIGGDPIKDSQIEQPRSLRNDDKVIEAFTQLAKEKLEGMMDGLLDAMVEKLRSGERKSEPDVEARAQKLPMAIKDSQFRTTTSSKIEHTIEAAPELENPGGDDLWPFKAIKTDDEVLKDEDERRRVLLYPKLDVIPDIWKHSWPSEWAEEGLRHSLIKELVVALHGSTTTYPYFIDDLKDLNVHGHISSILSVIGGVVGMFCCDDSLDENFHLVSPQPDHSFAIIVTRAIIEAAHNAHSLRLDRILHACFKKSYLFRPYMRSSEPGIQDINIAALAVFAVAMTDTCYYGPSLVLRDLFQDNNLKKIPTTRVVQYYRDMTFGVFRDRLCSNRALLNISPPTESATGSFRTYDLHLHSLVTLGKLEIEWTYDARSHLRLYFPYDDGRGRLVLFWFGCGTKDTSHYIAKVLVPRAPDAPEPNKFFKRTEFENTMKILLGHASRSEERLTRKAYAGLPVPWWLFSLCKDASSKMRRDLPAVVKIYFHHEKYVLGDIMELFPPDGIGGMAAHLSYKSEPNRCRSYSEFPIYGERLHALRLHMDGVRPKGLRGLFRDKRDPAVYHTFWFAVIFGTTSVILALASLLVSSLQTWAAFHPQKVNGNTSA